MNNNSACAESGCVYYGKPKHKDCGCLTSGASGSAPSVLLALADRCERETPAFILDQEIAVAIGCLVQGTRMFSAAFPPGQYVRLPNYTTSLDSAVTLVPEGYWWGVRDWSAQTKGRCWADVGPMNAPDHEGKAITVALALCAAALRARAALLGGDNGEA